MARVLHFLETCLESVFNFNKAKNIVQYHDITVKNFLWQIKTKIGVVTKVTLLTVHNVITNQTKKDFAIRTFSLKK